MTNMDCEICYSQQGALMRTLMNLWICTGTRIELLQGWDHIGVIHFLHLKLYFKAFLVGGFNPSENISQLG